MKKHFVYLIATKYDKKYVTYVGYSTDVKKRLLLHNLSKGAKFTRGRRWFLVFTNNYDNRSIALKEEHKLKKNYFKRKKLLKDFLKNKKIWNNFYAKF